MPYLGGHRHISNEIWQQAVRITIYDCDLIPMDLVVNSVISVIHMPNIPVVDDGRVDHTHACGRLEIYRNTALKTL